MSRSIRMEIPSLAKEGWLRPLRKSGEASLAGADGVVRSSHRFIGSLTNHPVRALQRNGTIYLMARPPLLCHGGEFHSDSSRHFRFIVFSPTPAVFPAEVRRSVFMFMVYAHRHFVPWQQERSGARHARICFSIQCQWRIDEIKNFSDRKS